MIKDNFTLLDPPASRLVESLRDTGYTFTTSIADIVDNSVAADATRIDIRLDLTFSLQPILMISDNGNGMDMDDLLRAMTYGSPKRPSPKSLGKFGMGLKTASTAFCKKLTLISRKEGQISTAQWDLERVISENKWELLHPEVTEYDYAIDLFEQTTQGGSGTIVIWEDIDRLVRTNVDGTIRTQINILANELETHLSGVFFNFLTTGNDYPNVVMTINNIQIQGWDPFCRWLNDGGRDMVEIHPNKPFTYTSEVNGEEVEIGTFNINVYILPIKEHVTPEELQRMRYGLNNQGFHIFREGRMIVSGGWPNRLFVKEPHLNLVRVECSFDYKLDDIFQIDIKKSRVDFPKELRDQLRKILTPPRNEANRRYRKGNKSPHGNLGSLGGNTIHDGSSNAIDKHLDENTANSLIESTNSAKGEAQVKNAFGTSTVKIKFDETANRVVQTSESLDDGVLWMPGLIDGKKHAVFLNQSHEFYKRFYLANKENTPLILAMDSLLWSLAEAELCVFNDSVKRNLENMRISVSKSLRTLAEELPEVEASENDDTEY